MYISIGCFVFFVLSTFVMNKRYILHVLMVWHNCGTRSIGYTEKEI